MRGRAQSIIYSDGQGSDNPYEKLRVKIEPTRLAVMVDPVERMPSSPLSSLNGSQHGMGGHEGGFNAFVRGTRSHGGSSCEQSQSPTESPMGPSWSRGGSGLPAMAPLPPHMGSGGNGGGLGGGIFGHCFDTSAGFDASSGMGGTLGGLGSMGGGTTSGGMSGGTSGGMSVSFGGNGLLPQQPPSQQQAPASTTQHSSPMRPGYYGGGNSFGSTPVF